MRHKVLLSIVAILTVALVTQPLTATAASLTNFTMSPASIVVSGTDEVTVSLDFSGTTPSVSIYTTGAANLTGGYVLRDSVRSPGDCQRDTGGSGAFCGLLGSGSLAVGPSHNVLLSCASTTARICARQFHLAGTAANDSLSVGESYDGSSYLGWMEDIAISSGDGDDRVTASPNTSGTIDAGPGNDNVRLIAPDFVGVPGPTGPTEGQWTVTCGAGDDTVFLGPNDSAAADCEHVTGGRVLQTKCTVVAKTTGYSVAGNRLVAFDASSSNLPSGATTTYKWDFGDSKSATTTSPKASHTYSISGEYTASLDVSSTGCSPKPPRKSLAVVADPVTTYAPEVFLRGNEKYFPSDVKAFLGNSALEYVPTMDRFDRRDIGCTKDPIAARGTVEAKRIGGRLDAPYSASPQVSTIQGYPPPLIGTQIKCTPAPSTAKKLVSNGTIAATSKTPLTGLIGQTVDRDVDDGLILDLAEKTPPGTTNADGSTENLTKYGVKPNAQNIVSAPVYYEYKLNDKKDGSGYIVYWFFYAYNAWKAGPVTETHEGDWEHVVVAFGPNSQAWKAAYYQHYCDAKIYSRSSLQADNDATGRAWHPLVFAALGGHASYPTNIGSVNKPACNVSGLGDTTGVGYTWQAYKSGGLVRAQNADWYGFTGNWGDRVDATISNYGPVGPGPEKLKQSTTVPDSFR